MLIELGLSLRFIYDLTFNLFEYINKQTAPNKGTLGPNTCIDRINTSGVKIRHEFKKKIFFFTM